VCLKLREDLSKVTGSISAVVDAVTDGRRQGAVVVLALEVSGGAHAARAVGGLVVAVGAVLLAVTPEF
jgi:hypothetical protein